jgi:tetratricopeptide (TPR) repeat protein
VAVQVATKTVEVATVVTSTPVVSTTTAVVSASTAAVSPVDENKRVLESTMALLEVAFFQQEWEKVIKLADQVTALDPSNGQAYKRLAGAYHAMKRHSLALKALKAAYSLESDPTERTALKAYIAAMKGVVVKESRAVVSSKPVRPSSGPVDIEKLYEAGVELYAQGRLSEAREAFRRCLQIDPNYNPAQRAFQRVQSEMIQTGKDQ